MAKETKKTPNAYILLDRSGSMQGRWDEALSSINAYVDELAKGGNGKVTLVTFDHMQELRFDVIRDGVSVKKWDRVTEKDATPRGGTPLFDALGRLVALAESACPDKTVIVVMTDGAENQSREFTKQGAKSALDRCKAKGWQVVFLGADFDAFGEAGQVGVSVGQTLNMAAGNYGVTMRNLAAQTMCWSSGDSKGVSFSAEDREIASGKLKPGQK